MISSRHTEEARGCFPASIGPLSSPGRSRTGSSRSPTHRLAGLLPDARLEVVAGSRALVPEDRPEELVALLRDVLEAPDAD